MRTTCFALIATALFASLAWSNGEGKTYYFTHPVSTPELTAMATSVRTMLQMTDVSIDEKHQAIVAHGPVDKLVAIDWLFHQLDRAPSAAPMKLPAEYKMGSEVLAVIPIAPQANNAELTAATTAIRTIVDIQRLFPYEAQHAILGLGSPEKVAGAEWVVQQVTPADGQPQTVDSSRYPMEAFSPKTADVPTVAQILRLDPKTTNAQLTAIVTAIRTVADLQRLFPFGAGPAIILRGSPEQADMAGWLVHEMSKPTDAAGVHQTTIPGLLDGVVRLFYIGPSQDSGALATQIRASVDIKRVFPFTQPPAVILRGRPDQMSTVESIVGKFTTPQ
jgi:hypothetical protein